MKLHYIAFFIYIFIFQNSKSMEQLYIKEEPAYKVIMNFIPNKETNKSFWEVIYYSKEDKETIILDKFEVNEYREPNKYEMIGDIRKAVIIGDAFLFNKSVYVMYCKFGEITFVKYQLSNESIKKINYYIEDEMRGSFANFGDPIFYAKIKPISSDYLGIVWNSQRIGTFDCSNNRFLSMSFSDDSNRIEYQMPDMINEYFTSISKSLKTVLDNDSISLLAYIEDYESEKKGLERTFGFIYFFYKYLNINEIKIIRYSNYSNDWLIGDYIEEKIDVEQN